jgi:hypothetical protein
MSLTDREFWTLVHGMGFGVLFLLGFAGGLEEWHHLGTFPIFFQAFAPA